MPFTFCTANDVQCTQHHFYIKKPWCTECTMYKFTVINKNAVQNSTVHHCRKEKYQTNPSNFMTLLGGLCNERKTLDIIWTSPSCSPDKCS